MENETHFFFYHRSATFSINDYTNPQANKKINFAHFGYKS